MYQKSYEKKNSRMEAVDIVENVQTLREQKTSPDEHRTMYSVLCTIARTTQTCSNTKLEFPSKHNVKTTCEVCKLILKVFSFINGDHSAT